MELLLTLLIVHLSLSAVQAFLGLGVIRVL